MKKLFVLVFMALWMSSFTVVKPTTSSASSIFVAYEAVNIKKVKETGAEENAYKKKVTCMVVVYVDGEERVGYGSGRNERVACRRAYRDAMRK